MESRDSVWLQSPVWDAFWLQSGLWLAPLVVGLMWIPGAAETLLVIAVFLLWLPHRFATAFNAYCTPAYRELLRTQRRRFVMIPAAALLLTFAFVFAPQSLVPWDSAVRVQVLATLFLGYNAWHFAMQHFGIFSIYRQRAGQRPSNHVRQWERGYCLGIALVAVLIAQMAHGAEVVESSLMTAVFPRAAIEPWFGPLRIIIPTIAFLLGGVFLINEARQPRPSLAKQLYAAGIAVQGMLAYWLPAPEFFLLWGVQHWLVSIGLAAHMARHDDSPLEGQSGWYRAWRMVSAGFLLTAPVLILSTIVLVPFFDLSVHPDNADKLPLLGPLIAYLLSNAVMAKFFIALNFGTVFIHFAMDRAVFRFSDPATRQVTGRLLFSR